MTLSHFSSASVAGAMTICPAARATRLVTSLAATSTMCAAPATSKCVKWLAAAVLPTVFRGLRGAAAGERGERGMRWIGWHAKIARTPKRSLNSASPAQS